MENILFAILSLIVGIVIGCGLFYLFLADRTSKSMKNANKLIEDAKKEADKNKRDALLELKQESYRLRQETDAEIKSRKAEILQIINERK